VFSSIFLLIIEDYLTFRSGAVFQLYSEQQWCFSFSKINYIVVLL